MQVGSALGYAVYTPAQAGRGSPQPLVPVSPPQGAALFQRRVGTGARGAAISLGLSAAELGSSPGCERGAARGAGGHPGRGDTPPGRRAARHRCRGLERPRPPLRRGQPAAGSRWPPPAPPRRGALAAGCAGGAAVPGPQSPHGSRGGLRRPPPALPGGGCGSGAGEPGELRVTGAPRAAAEDGHDRGRGRECGVKVPVSRSRLPRGARARCRVSARSGLSLPRFETFRRRPSPRHAPATAALAVPGSGQALASRRADPFSGRGRSEAASAGERAGKGAGSPAQGANPGAAPRLRTRGSASAAGSPRRAGPGPAPRRAAGSPRRPGKRCGPTACT
ncbi:collagen alpha-1(I) chain-like [Falco cherrug]|uniref:collagen alpha-1(I) chain-like n=1 Tax=Falco cherrug TaxID=345164 RepID=UPI002479F9ED|nr:collagen alpha-1(I) chain-like [Falco cherrug]